MLTDRGPGTRETEPTWMDREIEFNVEHRRAGETLVVVPSGEVDLATAPRIRAEVAAARHEGGRLVLDLRGVTFMDSTGLRLLVELDRELEDDGPLTVVRGSAEIGRLLDLSGLASRLTLVDDPAQAGVPGGHAGP